MTRGVEDHVEDIAVELALGRPHPMEYVHREGDFGPSKEKRGRRLVFDPRCDEVVLSYGETRKTVVRHARAREARVGGELDRWKVDEMSERTALGTGVVLLEPPGPVKDISVIYIELEI